MPAGQYDRHPMLSMIGRPRCRVIAFSFEPQYAISAVGK
jgi:hypothetical protein